MNRSSRQRRFPSRFGLSSNSRLNEAEANGASFVLDCLNWRNLNRVDSKFAFSRGTAGSFTGSNGLLQFASAGTPRFDHYADALGGSVPQATYRGLLIEGLSTNLACFSETFSTSGGTNNWNLNGQSSAFGGSATPAAVSGSAFQFRQTVANALTQPLQLDVTVTNAIHTFSIWVHGSIFSSIVTSQVALAIFQGGSPVAVTAAKVSGGSGTVSGTSHVSVSGLANAATPSSPAAWIRVQLTTNAPLAAGTASLMIYPDNHIGQVLNSSVWLYGAQFEARTNATSYIQTTTAQVTRDADGINFSNYTNASYGVNDATFSQPNRLRPPGYTLMFNAMMLRAAETGFPRILDFSEAAGFTRYAFLFNNAGANGSRLGGYQWVTVYSNEPPTGYTEPAPTSMTFETMAFTASEDPTTSIQRAHRSGAQTGLTSMTGTPSLLLDEVTQAGINRTQISDYPIVWLRWFAYYPYTMPVEELNRLTFNPNWR
jgi:hypothetical protein